MFARLMAVSRIGATAGATELQMKNRLRLLRAEKNWSQADLAERPEVSPPRVNRHRNGEKRLQPAFGKSVARCSR